MPEPRTSRWNDRAKALHTSGDDPYGPSLDGTVLVEMAAAWIVSLLSLALLPGTVKAIAAVAAFTFSLVIFAFGIRAAARRSDARACEAVADALSWLDDNVGHDRTEAAISALREPGALVRYVRSWQAVAGYAPSTGVLEAVMAGSIDADAFDLPHAVRSQCFPSTGRGWRTDDHACDVTPAALAAIAAGGEFTASSYRAALRREMYTPS